MLVVSAGVHVLSPGQKVTIWQDKTASVAPLAVQPPVLPKPGVAQAGTLPASR